MAGLCRGRTTQQARYASFSVLQSLDTEDVVLGLVVGAVLGAVLGFLLLLFLLIFFLHK